MSKFSVWGSMPPQEESYLDNGMDKEKLGEQKIMKNNVLVTSKIRKLMLRLELWNIYEKVFLSEDSSIKNKNRTAASLLDDALEGQRNAQQRIATIFSSDSTIENWESILSKLKFFEDESDTIPLVSTEDSTIPLTEITVEVRSSENDKFVTDAVLNFVSDPYQLACEIQVEHQLPAEEIDYIQGMLQHEMMGLVRQGMTDQREKLKSIQKKTAIIEHLVMLNENISLKFGKTSKMYDTSSSHLKSSASSASSAVPSFHSASAARAPVSSKNRTLVHFNKLIIDERRKLDQVEQEMVKLFKKMGKMSATDYYQTKSGIPIFTNGKEIPPVGKANASKSKPVAAPPPSPKGGGRRASVSLRSAMMQPLQVSTAMSFNEEEEGDEEDGDTFDGGAFSTPLKSNQFSSVQAEEEEEDEDELNLFGLSDHEKEKKILFRKSEKDRTVLIGENKRLRDLINSVDMGGLPSPAKNNNEETVNLDDGDLRGLINELNAWDIERDELDGQIDNLNDKKDELKRKLAKQKEKKDKKVADKVDDKLRLSMLMSSLSH